MFKIPQTLRLGSTGDQVAQLQTDLLKLGYNLGSAGANGLFNEDTEAAVMQFQKDKNLAVDGVVGRKTGKTLGASLSHA